MNRKQLLLTSLAVVAGGAGFALSLALLGGLETSLEGGPLASGQPSAVAGAGIVLIALATRTVVELVDATGRRARHPARAHSHPIGRA
jgi:hypothetical protein